MTTIPTHISRIRAGDTVLHDGKQQTVCQSNLKRDSFMGITLFGDSYRLGYLPVQKVVIERALPAQV